MNAKGRTAIKIYGGQRYVFNGYYPTPYDQKVKGICDLFAARNIHTGQVHYFFYDWKNSYIVVDFLQKLIETYPDKTIYIIWDGWSAHRSTYTRAFIDLHPQIKTLPHPYTSIMAKPNRTELQLSAKICPKQQQLPNCGRSNECHRKFYRKKTNMI